MEERGSCRAGDVTVRQEPRPPEQQFGCEPSMKSAYWLGKSID
jgi:hypothetical protein